MNGTWIISNLERASKLGMFSFPFFTLLGKAKQSGIEWNELGYSIFFLEIQIASNKVLFSNIRKHLDKVASDFESTIGGEREHSNLSLFWEISRAPFASGEKFRCPAGKNTKAHKKGAATAEFIFRLQKCSRCVTETIFPAVEALRHFFSIRFVSHLSRGSLISQMIHLISEINNHKG